MRVGVMQQEVMPVSQSAIVVYMSRSATGVSVSLVSFQTHRKDSSCPSLRRRKDDAPPPPG